MGVSNATPIDVNVVGSSVFGRYPKISIEKTYNMFISDNWLVNYAGFELAAQFETIGEGRGVFHSVRGNFILIVISGSVYRLGKNEHGRFVGTLDSIGGEVSMDENLQGQIAIADGSALYIYNYEQHTLTKQSLSFLGNPVRPSYVAYHNTFFLITSGPRSINPQNWYAATYVDANNVTILPANQLQIQTKPDYAVAIKRLPGKGNHILVLGTTVGEVWAQVGGAVPYQRVQSFNIDSGCVSSSTFAANEDVVCWLAQNENNAPTIMVTNGSQSRTISTDGIDYLLQNLKRPDQSTGFLYKQDGHLFYQLTFYDKQDNLSLIYDFNTEKFFHVCDEYEDYHPARQVVYFNKRTYFVSLNDGSLYRMGTDYLTYKYTKEKSDKGKIIPRIRIPKTIRKKDGGIFRAGNFRFWIEQGVNEYNKIGSDPINDCVGLFVTQDGRYLITQDSKYLQDQQGFCSSLKDIPRVDLSFSKNGNQSFSTIVGRELNREGVYRNELAWQSFGHANEITLQLRFWGLQRFVVNNGPLEIY